MVDKFFPSRPCRQPCGRSAGSPRGFTILELLVTLAVTGFVLAGTLTMVMSSRAIFAKDRGRVAVVRNLRDSLDVLGIDVRQAGERLPADFYAIEIVNGASGAPDTLVLRRNLVSEVLPLCGRLQSGVSSTEVQVGDTTSPPAGCAPVADANADGWPDNIGAWRDWRTAHAGNVPVYVFNPVGRFGEWMAFDDDGTTSEWIGNAGGPWLHTYEITEQCRLYMLEERRYTLNNGVLQFVMDQGSGAAQNVAARLTDFQVRAVLIDGTIQNTFDGSTPWSNLAAVEVTLSGRATLEGRTVNRSETTRFFPRNILSN